MATAISRDSFNELKNYLGVYLQQGRVILDADWNENQDIAVSFLRRLSREALGEGSPNRGFAIDPVFPPPPALIAGTSAPGGDLSSAIGSALGVCLADFVTILLYVMFGPLLFFLNFPGKKFDDFETADEWAVSSPQGVLRLGKDRPYEGAGFLRLSGHPGTVQVTKTLANLMDISAFELATFHYRLNQQTPGTMRFFVEDGNGNRSVWLSNNSAFARDLWLAGFAAPLDIRYRIITDSLPPGSQNSSYTPIVSSFGGTPPITWSVSAGALPAGVSFGPSGTGDASKQAKFSGTATTQGNFTFTLKAVDSTGKAATRQYTVTIGPPSSSGSLFLPSPADMLAQVAKIELPTGTPADLTRIRKYGFELYQDAAHPLVWDLDDLRLASSALEAQIGNNNFIIRGSQFSEFIGQITLLTILQSAPGPSGGTGGGNANNVLQNLLDLMNTNFQLAEPGIENAGRYYVAGYPCVQIQDVLYTDQADPNDPPLKPPPSGTVRKDLVYLDVFRQPVTYVDDPEIREIALGGPDTTTRLRVFYRVRVAQGSGNQPGALPADNGMGLGTLATEGSYTGQANRYYLVEIDTPGDIGTATFRWSDDNASTIQRVIEPVPPGSTRVTVEDAAGFHPGDRILIRKEFGDEEHQIASVFGNAITLRAATGAQLAALPAAARVPDFTTFSMADRPKIQRWNAFHVPITPDPKDSTTSVAIALNDGVQVRFGGRAMKDGDYWNFKTRFLAGDQAAAINPGTRIEQLSFQRPRGVEHRYSPLAILVRDGSDLNPDQIFNIQDRRQRIGNAATVSTSLNDVTSLTGTALTYLGGISLLPAGFDSKFVVFFSADLIIPAAVPSGAGMTVQVSFFNDKMTNPATDQKTGDIQDRTANVPLSRRPVNFAVPVNLIFSKSDTAFLFLPMSFVPTSVQVFVKLSGTGFSVQLSNIQVTVMELKKSY